MKTVYFVQHGMAFTKDIDETRPLLAEGVQEVSKVAEQLKINNIQINKIAHSGKLRALQTAAIFSERLNVDDVVELKGLKANDLPDELIEQIGDNATLYVGHLPNIQKVVAKLVAGDEDNMIIKFQNAAVVCVELDEAKTYIKWFLTPELCQLLN